MTLFLNTFRVVGGGAARAGCGDMPSGEAPHQVAANDSLPIVSAGLIVFGVVPAAVPISSGAERLMRADGVASLGMGAVWAPDCPHSVFSKPAAHVSHARLRRRRVAVEHSDFVIVEQPVVEVDVIDGAAKVAVAVLATHLDGRISRTEIRVGDRV
jgi:hypothetical protein